MILDFFISNGVVLWTLIVVTAPWLIIGIIAYLIIRKVVKRAQQKKVVNDVLVEMDFLEVEIQAHQAEFESAPTKSNVIQFPDTPNE